MPDKRYVSQGELGKEALLEWLYSDELPFAQLAAAYQDAKDPDADWDRGEVDAVRQKLVAQEDRY